MSLQSFAQVVSLTALFNLACNQHDRPLGRKVTGQFDCQVASSCGYEWFVALRYGTLGARTGGASLDFEGEGIGGAWHSADQGTSLEMSWNVLDVLKCLEMSWNVLKCLEMSWNVLKCLEMSWIFMYILTWNLNPTFQKFMFHWIFHPPVEWWQDLLRLVLRPGESWTSPVQAMRGWQGLTKTSGCWQHRKDMKGLKASVLSGFWRLTVEV